MALTLEAEQRLESVDLINFYNNHRETWEKLSKKTYDFTRAQFPEGAKIRPDDVARLLIPLLAVNDDLVTCLAEKKLKQKYWVSDFADLILDRTWAANLGAMANA